MANEYALIGGLGNGFSILAAALLRRQMLKEQNRLQAEQMAQRDRQMIQQDLLRREAIRQRQAESEAMADYRQKMLENQMMNRIIAQSYNDARLKQAEQKQKSQDALAENERKTMADISRAILAARMNGMGPNADIGEIPDARTAILQQLPNLPAVIRNRILESEMKEDSSSPSGSIKTYYTEDGKPFYAYERGNVSIPINDKTKPPTVGERTASDGTSTKTFSGNPDQYKEWKATQVRSKENAAAQSRIDTVIPNLISGTNQPQSDMIPFGMQPPPLALGNGPMIDVWENESPSPAVPNIEIGTMGRNKKTWQIGIWNGTEFVSEPPAATNAPPATASASSTPFVPEFLTTDAPPVEKPLPFLSTDSPPARSGDTPMSRRRMLDDAMRKQQAEDELRAELAKKMPEQQLRKAAAQPGEDRFAGKKVLLNDGREGVLIGSGQGNAMRVRLSNGLEIEVPANAILSIE